MSKYFEVKRELQKALQKNFEHRIEEILDAISVEDINLVKATENEVVFLSYFEKQSSYKGKEVLDENIITLHGNYTNSIVPYGISRDKSKPISNIRLLTDVVIILKTLLVVGNKGTEVIKNIYIYQKDRRLENWSNER